MELLTLKIKPLSSFATFPKGDTLFGQILAYLYLENDRSFDNYFNDKPKLIVSDMMPYGYVCKPNLPLACFKNESLDEIDKKEIRKQKFITLENLQKGHLHLCEKIEFINEVSIVKNSINRTSFTTDGDEFAPYGLEEKQFYGDMWMFILVESSMKEKVVKTIEKIGKYGFGKEASIGKGAFECDEVDVTINNDVNSKYALSISPTILKDSNIENCWYEPFTRFGKFGLHNAHTNAFKKPVLMADSGAVVKLTDKSKYFGHSVNNGTNEKVSHLQGYSIAIPFKIKDDKCLSIK